MSITADSIQNLVEPLLADMGLELVELQFRKEQNGWVLRFFIDQEQGVTLDDCVDASREIGAYLEVEDIIQHAYRLEVSSPGAERPLKNEKDFIRFIGKKAKIKMCTVPTGLGEQKVFIGKLCSVEKGSVLLETEEGAVTLDLSAVSRARLSL